MLIEASNMKITFTDNNSIIIEIIENNEIGDLSKPIAEASFAARMIEIVIQIRKQEEKLI